MISLLLAILSSNAFPSSSSPSPPSFPDYPVDPFGGTKTIILEEVNWMNGRNNFLGALYIVFGCFAIFASIGFGILQHQNPRKLADPDLIPTNARVAA